MEKGFQFISFEKNEVKLESKHKLMIIKIYNHSAHLILTDKEAKSNNKHYDWNYDGQNLIPRKYQDIVTKYAVMYKLL